MVELRTVPVLTALFGAFTMLEQPPRPVTMRAKKQAFAKTDGIRLKRKVFSAVSSERVSVKRCRDAAHMGTSREAARMGVSPELIRSRRQRAVAGRIQPPEPHNLAHKMRRESQPFRQTRK